MKKINNLLLVGMIFLFTISLVNAIDVSLMISPSQPIVGDDITCISSLKDVDLLFKWYELDSVDDFTTSSDVIYQEVSINKSVLNFVDIDNPSKYFKCAVFGRVDNGDGTYREIFLKDSKIFEIITLQSYKVLIKPENPLDNDNLNCSYVSEFDGKMQDVYMRYLVNDTIVATSSSRVTSFVLDSDSFESGDNVKCQINDHDNSFTKDVYQSEVIIGRSMSYDAIIKPEVVYEDLDATCLIKDNVLYNFTYEWSIKKNTKTQYEKLFSDFAINSTLNNSYYSAYDRIRCEIYNGSILIDTKEKDVNAKVVYDIPRLVFPIFEYYSEEDITINLSNYVIDNDSSSFVFESNNLPFGANIIGDLFTWDTQRLMDLEYKINIKVMDLEGNINSDELIIKFDNTGYKIDINILDLDSNYNRLEDVNISIELSRLNISFLPTISDLKVKLFGRDFLYQNTIGNKLFYTISLSKGDILGLNDIEVNYNVNSTLIINKSKAINIFNLNPVAKIAPIACAYNSTCTFSSLSSDLDGSIINNEWIIKRNGVQIKTLTNNSISHYFNQYGNYTISLQVEDNDNSKDVIYDYYNFTSSSSGNVTPSIVNTSNDTVIGHTLMIVNKEGTDPYIYNFLNGKNNKAILNFNYADYDTSLIEIDYNIGFIITDSIPTNYNLYMHKTKEYSDDYDDVSCENIYYKRNTNKYFSKSEADGKWSDVVDLGNYCLLQNVDFDGSFRLIEEEPKIIATNDLKMSDMSIGSNSIYFNIYNDGYSKGKVKITALNLYSQSLRYESFNLKKGNNIISMDMNNNPVSKNLIRLTISIGNDIVTKIIRG